MNYSHLTTSQAVFSNSTTHLVNSLFFNLNKSENYFSKHCILAPSKGTEYWLRSKLLELSSQKVFMGHDILSSPLNLIKALYIKSIHQKPLFPDFTTLPLLIHEKMIKQHLKITKDLPSFCKKNEPSYIFSQKLSIEFQRFFIYAQQNSYLKDSFFTPLFEDLLSLYTPIPKALELILNAFQKPYNEQNNPIHIFACSHLPKYILDFLLKLRSCFPIHFYVLSPSKEYFGDLLSDKTISFLYEKLKSSSKTHNIWDDIVLRSESQKLLANLSTKSKTTLNFFLDNELPYDEAFFNNSEDTSLKQLQNSFLSLSEIKITKQTQETIFITEAPNIAREVQHLFQRISSLLSENNPPEHIFIASPQLNKYSAYLEAIFEPHIPLTYVNSSYFQSNELKNKLIIIISLLEQNNPLYNLLYLFSSIHIASPLSSKEIAILQNKIHKFPSNYSEKTSSLFLDFINFLLEDYPFLNDTKNISSVDLLEKIIEPIYLLHELSQKIYAKKEHDSLLLGVSIFDLLENIFNLSLEELNIITSLKNKLQNQIENMSCSLSFFSDFCCNYFTQNHTSSSIFGKNGPFVGSLSDLSVATKQYTFIIGANKSSSSKEPSRLLDFSNLEMFESSPEEDENAHMLNMIISTQKELHMSYLSSASSPQLPMFALEQVGSTLSIPTLKLSNKPYSISNFTKETQTHSSLYHYFEIAQELALPKKTFSKFFITKKISPVISPNVNIDLLASALTYPLQHYLKTNYNLNISKSCSSSESPLIIPKNQLSLIWDSLIQHGTYIHPNSISDHISSISQEQIQMIIHTIESLKQKDETYPQNYLFSSQTLYNSENTITYEPIQIPYLGNNYFHGRITGVFSKGIYICSIDPSYNFKKTKTVPTKISSLSEVKMFLKSFISLAMLQLHTNCSHLCIREIFSKDEYRDLYLPENTPSNYLSNILKAYHFISTHPSPIITPSSWSNTHDQQKLEKLISSVIINSRPKDDNFMFWSFLNRNLSPNDFTNKFSKEYASIFDSLLPKDLL